MAAPIPRDAPVTTATFPASIFPARGMVVDACCRCTRSTTAMTRNSYSKGFPSVFVLVFALEDRRDSLTAANAHRHEGVPPARSLQLVECFDGQDGSGCPYGVAEGDPAPVWVGACHRQIQLANYRQSLRRERLVELDHVHVGHRQTRFRQHGFDGRHRSDS